MEGRAPQSEMGALVALQYYRPTRPAFPQAALDKNKSLRYIEGVPRADNKPAQPLKIPEAPSNVICGWADCKNSFEKRGNQRYCGKVCSDNARIVQNRNAKRRQRCAEFEQRRIEAWKSGLDLSAVRRFLRFRLSLRPLPWRAAPASSSANGVLLRLLSPRLPGGPPEAPAPSPFAGPSLESGGG